MLLIQLIIQSTEFNNQNPDLLFGQDVFVTILGGIIGSGASVWVFYQKIKNDKIEEENKRKQLQKEKIKYFKALIENTIKELDIEITGFLNFTNAIEANPILFPYLNHCPLNDLRQVIHKLNQEEYYHSYLGEFNDSKESIDEFRSIIAILSYFDSKISIDEDAAKKGIEFDYERKINLKQKIDKSIEHSLHYLINPDQEGNRLEFSSLIDNAMKNISKSGILGESDIEYYYTNFIETIINGILDKNLQIIPEAHQLIIELKNAHFIYHEIKLQNMHIATDFGHSYIEMKSQHKKLIEKSTRLIGYGNM